LDYDGQLSGSLRRPAPGGRRGWPGVPAAQRLLHPQRELPAADPARAVRRAHHGECARRPVHWQLDQGRVGDPRGACQLLPEQRDSAVLDHRGAGPGDQDRPAIPAIGPPARSAAGSTAAAAETQGQPAATRSNALSGRCSAVRSIWQNAVEPTTYWSDGRSPPQTVRSVDLFPNSYLASAPAPSRPAASRCRLSRDFVAHLDDQAVSRMGWEGEPCLAGSARLADQFGTSTEPSRQPW
jgi:hypothetical protein